MLDFRSVDRNNFRDILKLSVGEGQEHFVATNAYSLSQAKAQPECVPFAIYDGETLVWASACTAWTWATASIGFTA